ncbi:MAG TPA: hypothetical protein PL041_12795 [Melioribacteraceae bacterium]|nr:hypothetical protein [Melioribacteraceae bacterium]
MVKRIFIFLAIFSVFIMGETRYVSKTGTSLPPYTSWKTACDSIQKCINICNSGDTIYIDRGTYKEVIEIQNKDLILFGIDADECIIDGTQLIGSYSKYIMCYFYKSNVELNN